MTAYALSGSKTVAPYFSIGKFTVVKKKIRKGVYLIVVGDISVNMAIAIEQPTLFISD